MTRPGPSDDDVPRLPRGRGIRLAGPQIVKIVMVVTLLVAVLVLQRPCADAVGQFVGTFGQDPARAPAATNDAGPPQPDPYGAGYVEIDPSMTDEQIKAAIQRARAGALDAGAPAP